MVRRGLDVSNYGYNPTSVRDRRGLAAAGAADMRRTNKDHAHKRGSIV